MHAVAAVRKGAVQSAATLSGYRVRNEQNQDMGTIEELMIDPGTGQVMYVILSFGGFLGFGDRLYAVPWSLLSHRSEDRVFILPVDRETLERAPAFDSEQWPDLGDEEWGSRIRSHYGRLLACT